jgi:hypothetical protein
MSTRTLRAPIALVAAALAMLLGATACTGSKHQSTGPSANSSPSISIPVQSAPPAPTAVPTYTQYPVPTTVANDADKHKQVALKGCSSTPDGAAAAGTVHNTGSKSASYDITVFFTSISATAVNYATATVTVKPGASADFTARRAFAPPDQVLCVLAGVA